MSALTIGELARRCGLRTSAIRYYEKAGLLPKAARVSRQRRYTPEAIGRVRLVQLARDAGFSISETRTFVAGFSNATTPAARWQLLAQQKLADIECQMDRLNRMKQLLQTSFRCRCPSIDDCARAYSQA
jgi:MerR family transcriptional regulator, redox-sensitive transcriptional activator SoxR